MLHSKPAMALLLVMASLLTVSYAVESIRFSRPKSLADQFPEGMDNRPALFGVPPYGVSISGRVIYATPNDRDACQPLNTSVVESWPKPEETYIVMVDRGDCTFVTKVRHAQNVGAKAVLIIDNTDEAELPYMADDGTGATITVPSMLIHKNDGQAIKTAFADGVVVATLKWGVPNPDGTVEWALWTSSYDESSVELKASFEVVTAALGDYQIFEPHYFFLDGTVYGCDGNGGTACGNQCVNSGKYCAVDPEHDLDAGVSGADVVRENLRQLCIWRKANSTGHPETWWKYINCFQKECIEKETFDLKCSRDCQAKFGIDKELINECVSSSGGAEDQSTNTNNIIKAEIDARANKGVFLLPSVTINNVPFRGNLNCPSPVTLSQCGVLSAICAGYASGTAPDACSDNQGCPIGQVRDACGSCGGDGTVDACGNCLPQNHPDRRDDASKCNDVYNSTRVSVSAAGVVGIVFLMVSVVALGFFYIHRRSQANMRRELADIMAQYVPLGKEEQDGDEFGAVPSAIDSTGHEPNERNSF